jgi:hypothetical protein
MVTHKDHVDRSYHFKLQASMKLYRHACGVVFFQVQFRSRSYAVASTLFVSSCFKHSSNWFEFITRKNERNGMGHRNGTSMSETSILNTHIGTHFIYGLHDG